MHQRLRRPFRSAAAAITLLIGLAACGGGGGGGDPEVAGGGAASPAPSPTPADPAASSPGAGAAAFTYDGEVLPGRLVVTSPLGDFVVYSLASGLGQAVGERADVWWEQGQSPDTLVRWDDNLYGSQPVRVSFFDTTTWQQNRPDLIVRPQFRYPKLSADGRYLMALWRDDTLQAEQFNNPMTVIETATGTIVKRDWSLIDTDTTSTISSPVDWLPDNSYVFLDGRNLFRATLSAAAPTFVATLALHDNVSTGGADSTFVRLKASPDGTRFAFTWNGHIWVANVDGTGLHRLTALAQDSVNQVLGAAFGSPSWSPDSRWVSGVLYRSDTSVAPVLPVPGDTIAPPYQVVGTTGCVSPVFVLRADAAPTTIPWPEWPVFDGVRVRGSGGRLLGLSTCSTEVHWIR